MIKEFWQKPLRQQTIIMLVITVVITVVVSAVTLIVEWYAVSPIGYGGQSFLFFETYLYFPLAGAILSIPVSVIALSFRKTRKHAWTVLVSSIIYIIIGLPAFHFTAQLADPIRAAAFCRLADRSMPLVEAIHRYYEDNGNPPTSLEALVPKYIAIIPNTGMPTYPKYDYSTGEAAKGWEQNPWVLYVWTHHGFPNFDMFLYFPMQNYPEKAYGGTLKRIGKWAYLKD